MFAKQLAATRSNLERLEALAAKHPELFEHAYGIYVETDSVKVYIHADRDPAADWLAFAKRWSDGSWKRERSAVCAGWDYLGSFGGVELCIIGAEKSEKPEPLFGEVAA